MLLSESGAWLRDAYRGGKLSRNLYEVFVARWRPVGEASRSYGSTMYFVPYQERLAEDSQSIDTWLHLGPIVDVEAVTQDDTMQRV